MLLEAVGKFRFLLGRHLIFLSSLSRRSTYRRLKFLEDNKYLVHKRVLYGVPALYTLAHKGKVLMGLNKREGKQRLEQIEHDILVADSVFFILKKHNLTLNDIKSEKELYSLNGFGSRKHYPDFTFEIVDKSYAVEIELSLKAKETLRKNVQLNFTNYDTQIWLIRKTNNILKERLGELTIMYPNIVISYLEDVIQNVEV